MHSCTARTGSLSTTLARTQPGVSAAYLKGPRCRPFTSNSSSSACNVTPHYNATKLLISTLPYSQRLNVLVAAAASSATQQQQQEEAEESCLYNLLVWLVNNGVTGIGRDDSKVELYEDADGDRGIIAAQDIAAGEQLIRVPLRLAITDVLDEQQKQQLVGQGALWQDRLVAKLLQQVQAGRDSPWYPYLQALPKQVPSALECFGEAEAAEVQLPAVAEAIRNHASKMAASWQSCRPDSIGGADLQTYRWAHSVVMSRTFGNASQTGGIGVRMLVPLIDMLNHAADETDSGLLFDTATAKDNVRWDVVSPENSPNNCWEMVLSTTQHIPAEAPLLLSYFEGGNDEFLLHYGFVPPGNPHDTVQLFSSITAALEHFWHQDMAQGKSAEQLSALYQQALDAGLAALQQEVAAAAAGADDANWGAVLDALEPIKVASGSRVSGSLIAALEVLHQGDMSAVEAAVVGLAWQQLQALPTHLLADLAMLIAHAQAVGDDGAVQLYGRLLRYYSQTLIPEYAPELHDLIHAPTTATAAAGTANSSSTDTAHSSSTSTAAAALSQTKKKRKKAVPGPAAVVTVSEQQATAASTQGAIRPPLIQQLPLATLVDALLLQNSNNANSRALSPAICNAVKFRVGKKMLLADVVIAAGVPHAVLQQQSQQQLAAATGGRQAEQECQVLPWQSS